MKIEIKNKRCKEEKILKEYPDAEIIDVTSKGDEPWQKLSPFYPHGGIPVPFSEGAISMCVEGVWQGLKVFEHEGIDRDSFRNGTMRNIKRTVRTHGRCKGHQKGVRGTELLEYIDARKEIYVPTYMWMLEHRCRSQLKELAAIARRGTLVLLDYDTNDDVENPAKPLSHASLIKRYLLEHQDEL